MKGSRLEERRDDADFNFQLQMKFEVTPNETVLVEGPVPEVAVKPSSGLR
jgi:hypothetical protein